MAIQKGFIDEDFYNRVMEDAYECGVREVGLFINGEPFVNVNLGKFIHKAKKIGYEYVYITTNGALAHPDRIKEVIDCGLDSIKFSINAATQESYKLVHGRDDFDTVCRNLSFCHDYREGCGKKYNIFGSFVVTKITERETELFKENLSKFFDEFAFYKMRGQGGLMLGNAELGHGFTARSKCSLPFNTININYDGKLMACCEDINHNIAIDDLNLVPLKEAWYGENMTNFRKMHLDGKLKGTLCEACLAVGGGVVEILEL
jgi:MoaA/NifB/PqqE/SkfB family radical SAM enzyme